MPNRCSRCGKEINAHQYLNNTFSGYLFPHYPLRKIEHEKYEIAKEYCRFSFCDTCYIIAKKEIY